MHSFEELSALLKDKLAVSHFPTHPSTLYRPADYFLGLGGKRIRPVMCLMGNELFADILPDTYHAAVAIELFHNFTLIHDDIMDKAPLRRGMQTVHARWGEPTALLTGDVMLVVAYDYLNKIRSGHLHSIIHLFNQTAREVCEGQQLDMDFEKAEQVSMPEYIRMIELKTSVLMAASLQMGALLAGAGEQDQQHLYAFGKNLGISFQIQDDYLDAFGNPEKFGKQIGGDILADKKTFLMVKALETVHQQQLRELKMIPGANSSEKIAQWLATYKACGVDQWAMELKEQYKNNALVCLEQISIDPARKKPLLELADFLIQRDY
ncbi:MAG: polyprenyl synthetase family protein [Williamsia sp.]|nr:polyprenyl synthetase family protein [Williamsia sp.]